MDRSQFGTLADGNEFLRLGADVVRFRSDQLLALTLLDDVGGPA